MTQRRPIALWRIVGGAALHFVVPAYLFTTPVAAILSAPSGATAQRVIAQVPGISAWFLSGYAALTLVSLLAAVAIEPLLRLRTARREARDPEAAPRASRPRVVSAITEGTRTLGADSARVLDGFRGERWDHADPRFQSLSADLAHMVHASAAALASAQPARRAVIAELTTTSLARIDAALTELQVERGRLDEGDVHTIARYVETRYGPSDFAGEDP